MTMALKLYMHPVSTASRPVRLLIAEKKLDVKEQVVDLMTGEHFKDEYTALNPSRMVPMLEEGDFRLTESSAILKYLGSKFNLPEYPTDLQKRARVDEVMDWFNTQFYRDYGYGLLYPQIFPHHKRPNDDFHNGVVSWGKDKTKHWFSILDKHYLGNSEWVAGDSITIADYFGGCIVTAGEIIRCTFEGYPNVQRWVANIKKLGNWPQINEVMYGFAGALKDQKFENV
ncbi:MAG: glutathione S-transferase family protein [Kofleriaceae bacterium]|nr:glutathione S-transferase family protein [Kofleriaceae bacterium]